MWIFTPGGLLMPARIPNGGTEGTADPKLTNDGEYTMQVRGRVDSHLTNFIRDYMEPLGLPYSDIEYTPQLDYNVRFYTTPEAFSQAIAQATLDIDFLKFKPTAERRDEAGLPLYKDGKAYHSTLNSIWSTLTRLGAPGGTWGAYSATNKNGYKSAKNSPYGGNRESEFSHYDNRTGSTFFENVEDWEEQFDTDGNYIGGGLPDEAMVLDDWDGTDERGLEAIATDLIEQMSDLAPDQWHFYLTAREQNILRDYHELVKSREREQSKQAKRREFRNARKNKHGLFRRTQGTR